MDKQDKAVRAKVITALNFRDVVKIKNLKLINIFLIDLNWHLQN